MYDFIRYLMAFKCQSYAGFFMVVFQFTLDKFNIKKTPDWFLWRRGHWCSHFLLSFSYSYSSKVVFRACMLHSCGQNHISQFFLVISQDTTVYYVFWIECGIKMSHQCTNTIVSIITLTTQDCVTVIPIPIWCFIKLRIWVTGWK